MAKMIASSVVGLIFLGMTVPAGADVVTRRTESHTQERVQDELFFHYTPIEQQHQVDRLNDRADILAENAKRMQENNRRINTQSQVSSADIKAKIRKAKADQEAQQEYRKKRLQDLQLRSAQAKQLKQDYRQVQNIKPRN